MSEEMVNGGEILLYQNGAEKGSRECGISR